MNQGKVIFINHKGESRDYLGVFFQLFFDGGYGRSFIARHGRNWCFF